MTDEHVKTIGKHSMPAFTKRHKPATNQLKETVIAWDFIRQSNSKIINKRHHSCSAYNWNGKAGLRKCRWPHLRANGERRSSILKSPSFIVCDSPIFGSFSVDLSMTGNPTYPIRCSVFSSHLSGSSQRTRGWQPARSYQRSGARRQRSEPGSTKQEGSRALVQKTLGKRYLKAAVYRYIGEKVRHILLCDGKALALSMVTK